MKEKVAELVAALNEKGALLKELKDLLQVEQSCLVSLDMTGLEENQQEMSEAIERLTQLAGRCKGMIAALGREVDLADTTLSALAARLAQPEQGALREAQAKVVAGSSMLTGVLSLNRGLLEDSLKVAESSAAFFNRLFNPGDTYGMGGTLVPRPGGSRFVCKEV